MMHSSCKLLYLSPPVNSSDVTSCMPVAVGAYESLDLEMVTDYVEAIKGFPAMPKPEIFGLHENADITCDQNETYNLFSTILALQPRVSGGGGASREDTILQLCETINAKVSLLCHTLILTLKYQHYRTS